MPLTCCFTVKGKAEEQEKVIGHWEKLKFPGNEATPVRFGGKPG
jgi:hypothetical protein